MNANKHLLWASLVIFGLSFLPSQPTRADDTWGIVGTALGGGALLLSGINALGQRRQERQLRWAPDHAAHGGVYYGYGAPQQVRYYGPVRSHSYQGYGYGRPGYSGCGYQGYYY